MANVLVSELALTIAGASKRMAEDTLRVSYQANGRASLELEVVSNDGSYVPAMDAEVVLTDAVTGDIFGGYVMTPEIHGATRDGQIPIMTRVEAAGYAQLAERRYVNEVIPPGTLKAALQRVVPYLPGVTLDGAQVNGPSLPALVLDYVEALVVLDQLATLSGYVWKFTGLSLRMFAPGTFAAPFNLAAGDGNAIGDVTVSSSRLSQIPYANRVVARSSTAVGWVYGEAHLGNGSARTFQLNQVAVSLAADISPALIVSTSVAAAAVVTTVIPHGLSSGQSVDIADVVGASPAVNGTRIATVIDATHFSIPVNTSGGTGGTGGTWVRTNIESGSVMTFGAAGVFIATFAVGVYGVDDMPWTFDASSNSLIQRADQTVIPGGGGYVFLSYATRLTVVKDDLTEQAGHGVWENVVVVDTPLVISLIDFATAYLLVHKTTPRTVKYRTYRKGVEPGQTQTINLPTRGVNASFLITAVDLGTEGDLVYWDVTAIEGTIFQGSWQDTYTLWNSSGSNAASAAAGISTAGGAPVIVTGGGGYFWLGGNAQTSVNTGAGSVWVPVDGSVADPGTFVILDPSSRSSPNVRISVLLRTESGTVTARLRNVTDGVTVGTSSGVTTATYTLVQFTATLSGGEKLYRLELMGSTGNVYVSGIGWGE